MTWYDDEIMPPFVEGDPRFNMDKFWEDLKQQLKSSGILRPNQFIKIYSTPRTKGCHYFANYYTLWTGNIIRLDRYKGASRKTLWIKYPEFTKAQIKKCIKIEKTTGGRTPVK